MTTRRPAPLWIIAVLLCGALAAGCEIDAGPGPDNVPPDTFFFVEGDTLNTLHYRQILKWWGSDTDGEVIAYLVRLSGPWTPDADDSLWATDPSWVWTTATTDTFDIPVDGTAAERTVEVRAIDDDGVLDPTPASQALQVTNFAPAVQWSEAFDLPETSLPAVSFAWSPSDPDGRSTVNRTLMWIDNGNPGDSLNSVRVIDGGDTLAAVLPEQFIHGPGEYTLKLQVIDDAATRSNVLEHTWTVADLTGKSVLVIDNVDAFSVPGGSRDDSYHRAIAEAVAGPDAIYVIDVKRDGGFRSDREVFPLFNLFDAVIWYSGVSDGRNFGDDFQEGPNDASMRTNLEFAEKGLTQYLQGGGRVFLVGTNLFGNRGGLSDRFLSDVAGIDSLFTFIDPFVGLTTDIELPRDTVLVSPTLLNPTAPPSAPPDSLVMRQTLLRIEYFAAPPDDERLLWLRPGTIDTVAVPQQATSEFHCGLRRRTGAGRLAFTTFPMSRADLAGNHEAVGRAILEWVLAP